MKRTALLRRTPMKPGKPLNKRAKTKPGVISDATLDRLFSLAVRARDGTCQIPSFMGQHCGGPLECSHIISRAYPSMRWELTNALAVCKFHHGLQHDNPNQSKACLTLLLGQSHMDSLRAKYLAGIVPDALAKREMVRAFRRIIEANS